MGGEKTHTYTQTPRFGILEIYVDSNCCCTVGAVGTVGVVVVVVVGAKCVSNLSNFIGKQNEAYI